MNTWVDIWRVNDTFFFGIIDVYSFFSLRYKNAWKAYGTSGSPLYS